MLCAVVRLFFSLRVMGFIQGFIHVNSVQISPKNCDSERLLYQTEANGQTQMKTLKSLLSKEPDLSRAGDVDLCHATTATIQFAKQDEIVREFADDPTPDSEIIDGIEDIYFSDMTFDSSCYELQTKLPETLTEESLDKYRNTLRRQLQAVSRQLSHKILENQMAYVRELDRVMDLESNLCTASSTCSYGRIQLDQAKKEITIGGLEILSKNRRMLMLQKLLDSLRFIKTLQETDVRLKELLVDNNYPSAIQLCLECQHAIVTLHQFTCVSELSTNLQETLEQIEEKLDVALSNLCINFDRAGYWKIQEAYKLLGKTQIAMDQLQMHFMNTINTVATLTISEILKTKKIIPQDYSYNSLCQHVPLDEFTSTLIQLCQKFWTVMYCYRQTILWHEEYSSDMKTTLLKEEVFLAIDHKYVENKLIQGRAKIWQDIQQKVKAFVLSTNFGFFKYDDFIKILHIINSLITIGEEFSGLDAHLLQESIRLQTVNYFKAFHKSTLEELKMFLENEAWEMCPVKSNFTLFDLKEFYFMKTDHSLKSRGIHDISDENNKGCFDNENLSGKCTPFDNIDTEINVHQEKDNENVYEDFASAEDVDDDYESDVPDELKLDYVDECTGEDQVRRSARKRMKSETSNQLVPFVTNTTLNVLRAFGKYMHMMNVLKPIAFDVVICMSQLFDYYLYAVYMFFTGRSGGRLDFDHKMEDRLKVCLTRIENNIILKEDVEPEATLKIQAPHLSPMVNLEDCSSLFGLTHKIIGVESLIFLSRQLRVIYKNLDALVPPNRRAFLGQFYSQTVDVVVGLREPIFKTTADRAILFEKVLQMMSLVKWDVKEIMSQHSAYVDLLVQEYISLQKKLELINSTLPLPQDALLTFWKTLIRKTNHLFVDGFSSVKKCSNEGRALMLLDFQQFLIKIDKIAHVKPVPEREYVENYIKAYYLSESDLENWLKDHQEYNSKHLNSLVTCGTGAHIGKKMRQKLTGLLEDLESKSKLKNNDTM